MNSAGENDNSRIIRQLPDAQSPGGWPLSRKGLNGIILPKAMMEPTKLSVVTFREQVALQTCRMRTVKYPPELPAEIPK